MTRRIYRGILTASVVTLLACLIFTVGIQYQMYDESTRDAIKDKAYIISLNIGEDNFSEYEDIKERITLIDPDGKVIYDNRAIAAKMQNHADRAEVKQALKNGDGYAVRRSETLGSKTCYYALKLKNGNVLRVADDSLTVWATVVGLMPALCAVAVMTFVLAAVLANVISKKIVKPINAIDLSVYNTDAPYDELVPLVRKINAQNKKINRQIEALTRNSREFEAISENMSEGLVLTDLDGNILTHNKGAEKLFSTGGDINGKNILVLNRSETFRNVFEEIKNGAQGEGVLELSGRYYSVTVNPVRNENGGACGAVVLAVDVTEKEKREKLRREFTANVSHELKTPLTAVSGISDMLKNGMVKPEDVKGFAEDINREASRLISLVNDIIKLSELDEGAYDKTDGETDLAEVARDVAKRIAPVAAGHNVTVKTEGESAVITGSDSLVSEMVYNLCDNAVKYNRPGGSVTLLTGTKDGKRFVTVKDTGIGIPPEQTDRIFERFYRVDKSRSKQSGGTGLGLSIVKHIAQALGGKITVESRVGKGTEITVTF